MIPHIVNSFFCAKDADIESFLKVKAVEFEKLYKSRTYLICDSDKLAKGEFLIAGYFSLSLKALVLPDDMSIRTRKELDGYRGKIHGAPIREIPCYLIGQLSKNSSVNTEGFSGVNILEEAFKVLDEANKSVGGRYVMVECHNNQKLLDFYQTNGFKIFGDDTDVEGMIQLIRPVHWNKGIK